MKFSIPVSVGELIDKITILEIKEFLTNDKFVREELEELNLIRSAITQYISHYEIRLKKINEQLWKVEDRIREKERLGEFDEEFIQLARSVYKLNDKRAELKRKINEITKSDFRELKIYAS